MEPGKQSWINRSRETVLVALPSAALGWVSRESDGWLFRSHLWFLWFCVVWKENKCRAKGGPLSQWLGQMLTVLWQNFQGGWMLLAPSPPREVRKRLLSCPLAAPQVGLLVKMWDCKSEHPDSGLYFATNPWHDSRPCDISEFQSPHLQHWHNIHSLPNSENQMRL